MSDVLTSVHLHARAGDLVGEPGARGLVVGYEIETDADGTRTARWDVVTNLWVGPDARDAMAQLGNLLHALSHLLLTEQGVVLDLRPPADEPDPDREHDERAANGGA